MTLPQKEENVYSYRDYLNFPDNERWELIDGVPYMMSPAPSTNHQRVLGKLYRKFSDYLEGKTCEVLLSLFDVRLALYDEKREDELTVVQPDLTIVCDPEKIDEKGCAGTPDMLVEILSPATAKMDKIKKRELYERAGVREYWIVDPVHQLIEAYVPDNGKFILKGIYSLEDRINVSIFADCGFELKDILV